MEITNLSSGSVTNIRIKKGEIYEIFLDQMQSEIPRIRNNLPYTEFERLQEKKPEYRIKLLDKNYVQISLYEFNFNTGRYGMLVEGNKKLWEWG